MQILLRLLYIYKACIQQAPACSEDSEFFVDVAFPQIIPELVTEKVMVMTYINGVKITEAKSRLSGQEEIDRYYNSVSYVMSIAFFCVFLNVLLTRGQIYI